MEILLAVNAVIAIKRLCIMFAYFFLHGRKRAKSRDPTIQINCAGKVAYKFVRRYIQNMTIKPNELLKRTCNLEYH